MSCFRFISSKGSGAIIDSVERVVAFAWRDISDVDAGGSEVYLDAVLSEFASWGLDVTLHARVPPGQEIGRFSRLKKLTRNGYRLRYLGGPVSSFPLQIIDGLISTPSDRTCVLDVWNGIPFFSPLWFRGPRVTLLHHAHSEMWKYSVNPIVSRFASFAEISLISRLYRREPVVCLSESSKVRATSTLFLKPENVHVIQPGVCRQFVAADSAKFLDPTVIVVARLTAAKRIEALVEQMMTVKRHVPNLRLLIVGRGPLLQSLIRAVRSGDADSWISVLGWLPREQVIEYMARSWLHVSMSAVEGWGLTVSEAGRCGTASVVCDSEGLRDSVLHMETGLVVPYESMWDAVIRLLRDDALRDQLAAGARAMAKDLTWAATAESLLSVIEYSLESRKR